MATTDTSLAEKKDLGAPETLDSRNDAIYITFDHDQTWPVILCDDSIPPKSFMKRGVPSSMTRPRPAILLGRRKFAWVDETLLFEFFPDVNYLQDSVPFEQPEEMEGDSREVRLEKQRRKAYERDVLEGKDAAAWNHVIRQEQKALKIDTDRRCSSQGSSQKRSRSSHSMIDGSDQSTPYKKRKVSSTPHSISPTAVQSYESRYDRMQSTLPLRIMPCHDSVFSELDKAAQESHPEQVEGGIASLTKDELTEVKRAYQATRLDSMCTIFVGREKCPFVVFRRLLHKCEHLKNLEIKCKDLPTTNEAKTKDSNTSLNGFTIDLTTHTDITPKSFLPLFQFFRNDDLGPLTAREQLLNPDRKPDLSPNMEVYWATHLATGFLTARAIHHQELQRLIREKIEAFFDISPLAILTVAVALRSLGAPQNPYEKALQAWIRSQISTCFWLIARERRELLQEVLEGDDGLRRDVFEELARHGETGKIGL